MGLVRKGSEGGVTGPIQGTAWLDNVSPALGGNLNLSRRQSCCPPAKLPHAPRFARKEEKVKPVEQGVQFERQELCFPLECQRVRAWVVPQAFSQEGQVEHRLCG